MSSTYIADTDTLEQTQLEMKPHRVSVAIVAASAGSNVRSVKAAINNFDDNNNNNNTRWPTINNTFRLGDKTPPNLSFFGE